VNGRGRATSGRVEGGDAQDDAGRAEPALRGTVGGEALRPLIGGGQSVERRDGTTGDPGDGRDAGDTGMAVDPDGAAAALPLGAAAVLRRTRPEPVAQDLQERGVVSLDFDVAPVEGEMNQLKLWPQPQVREAFGLVIANPDCSRPSL
jgi:hypothetical protein